MPSFRTHYDNLKVARDAPIEVIKSAYRALANKYHPDRNPGCDKSAAAMKVINASYEALVDEERRREHDKWIEQNSNPTKQRTTPAPPYYSAPPAPRRSQPATVGEAVGCLVWIIGLLVFGNWIFTSCAKQSNGSAKTYSVPAATPRPTPITSLRTPLFDPYGRLQPKVFRQRAFIEAEIAFPSHGTAVYLTKSEAVAPLEIRTETGSNYLIKLCDPKTQRDIARFYVVGGQPAEFLAPLGSFSIKFAAGQKWYGEKHLFGQSTQYARFDELMDFTSTVSSDDSLKLTRLRAKLDATNAAVKDFLVRSRFNRPWIDYIFNKRDPKTNVLGIDRLDSNWWKSQLQQIKNPRVHNELVNRLNKRLQVAREYYGLLSTSEKIKGVSLTMHDVTNGNIREKTISAEDFNEPQPKAAPQM